MPDTTSTRVKPASEFYSWIRLAAFFGAGCFMLAHLLEASSIVDLFHRAAVVGVAIALGFLLGFVAGAME